MIIGIDISSIPYGTGVSNYTQNLVLELLAIDHLNHYKLFFSSFRQKLPSDFINKLEKFPQAQLFSYRFPPTFLSFIWNKLHIVPINWLIGPCDVFHTSDWTQPPLHKCHSVCTIHDLSPFLYPKVSDPRIIRNHKEKMYWSQKESSYFICVSKNTQSDLLKLFPLIAASRTAIVYEAAENKYFDFYKLKDIHKNQLIESIKIKYHLQNFILAQGTREPRKNLHRLIKAFDKYKSQHPKSTLQLAITGKYGWGNDIPLKNKDVIVLGYVDENDLVQLHAAAVALVFPSLYEGFGLPLIKSMAVGTPVITSNTSSLAEIANKAALLVNPKSIVDIANAINKIQRQPLRRTLISKGITQAKLFSWEKTARETLKMYQKACS